MNKMEVRTYTRKQIEVMNKRFTMIAEILPLMNNKEALTRAIKSVAAHYNVSTQTIRNYLKAYQETGTKEGLAPKGRTKRAELTAFEKDIRWALNKFYYTTANRSLNDAYILMIKERYYHNGVLDDERPSFWQFRYYYRKHNKKQNELISRKGLSAYQRDYRPLLGEGVQEYCSAIGSYMLDSTICDIYLVDDDGNNIGRPLLTAAVDGYSGLLCGYALGLEGGTYSLRKLVDNIVTDKVAHCLSFGISITEDEWPCKQLGGKMITDRGKEYTSEGFAQLTELGVIIDNLPPYRPELKSKVEKFFDLIQDAFKPFMKGKGIVEADYKDRGATDYRKQACLTMRQFETILLRCIIYYNTGRVIEGFPYSEKMLEMGVKPYASSIWTYSQNYDSAANLIDVEPDTIHLTMLPRANGRFSRKGLEVNKLRYKADGFQNEYLEGMSVVVAFDPKNVDTVYLISKDGYIPFELIESRYAGSTRDNVKTWQSKRKEIIAREQDAKLLSKVQLAEHIETIARGTVWVN